MTWRGSETRAANLGEGGAPGVRPPPSVVDVVWPSGGAVQQPADDVRALRRRLGWFGALPLVVGVGSLFLGHIALGAVACTLGAATVLLARLASDATVTRVDAGVERAALAVGHLVAVLLLTPVYVLLFVPLRVLRRRHLDEIMPRRPDRASTSYWTVRDGEWSGLDRPF
jgi:hypothetical protein